MKNNNRQQWLIKHKGDSAFCRAVAESNPAKSLIWFENENLKQNNRFGYSAFAETSGDNPLRFIAGPLPAILTFC
jgi:hypothetical protein